MSEKKVGPRDKRITWQDRHMLEAMLTSKRSPDPSTQVGACIVNQKNRVLATGYNSYPNGVGTWTFSWERSHKDPLKTKYPFVVHGESNAIHNAISPVTNCTLYTTLFPCNDCAKDIIQAGITKIFYLTDLYPDTWQTKAAKQMFDTVDIITVQHKWQNKESALSCLQEMINLVKDTE